MADRMGVRTFKDYPTELDYSKDADPAQRCEACEGLGVVGRQIDGQGNSSYHYCDDCDGVGYFGIDPDVPTIVHGKLKLAVLIARGREEKPLFTQHDSQKWDVQPKEKVSHSRVFRFLGVSDSSYTENDSRNFEECRETSQFIG